MFGNTLNIFHITQLLKIVRAEECMKFFCWGAPCNKNYFVNITHYKCILVKKPATVIIICELHYYPLSKHDNERKLKMSCRHMIIIFTFFFLLQPVGHTLHFWHTIFWENTRSALTFPWFLTIKLFWLIQRRILSWIKVFLLSGTCKYKNCLGWL